MGLRRRSARTGRRSFRHPRKLNHPLATRRRRLVLETLEARLALAGVFTEDFSSDADPAQPGFDSAADGIAIINNLPPPVGGGQATPIPGGRGVYYLQPGIPGDPGWGLYADGHVLVLVGSNISLPAVTITLPPPGTPGGPAAQEEAIGIGVSVQGFGLVQIHGEFGTKVVNINSGATWQRIVGERDEILPSGFELGAIRELAVYSYEYMAVDIVSVQVGGDVPDQPPVAVDDEVLIDRQFGVSEIFNPLDNDFDPEAGPVEFANVAFTGPSRGSLVRVDDQFGNLRGFVYTASAEALADPTFREDNFSYTVRDSLNQWDSATVRLIVNTSPAAILDDYELPHGYRGSFDTSMFAGRSVLDNDFDPDSDSLTITGYGQPQHGTVSLTPDGRFQYTPTTQGGLVLPDAFTYDISDGYFIEQGTVLIHVPNTRPVAESESFDRFAYGTAEPLLGTVPIQDADGDALVPILVTPPQYGTVELAVDPATSVVTWAYEPHPRYGDPLVGDEARPDDRFSFVVSDGYTESDLATQWVLANAPPTAEDDALFLSLNPAELPPLGEFRFDLSDILDNDSDLDGDAVFAGRIVRQPQNGTTRFDFATGTLVYQSHNLVSGIDTFTYRATDLRGESQEATVEIYTRLVPLIRDDRYSVNYTPAGQPAQGIAYAPEFGPFANDLDANGHPAFIDGFNATVRIRDSAGTYYVLDETTDVATVSVANGQVTLWGDGTIGVVPTPGFIGYIYLNYEWEWQFPTPKSGRGEVTFHVVNRAPVAIAGGPYTIFEGQSIVLDGSASYDPDGDPIEGSWHSSPRTWHGVSPTLHWHQVEQRAGFDEYEDRPLWMNVNDGFNQSSDGTILRIRGDGIHHWEEDGGPNGGDSNYDGIADSAQGNVASLRSPHSGFSATLISPPGTFLVGIDSNPSLPPRSIPGAPSFNLGFSVAGLPHGGTTVVSIVRSMLVNTYAKYGPRPNDPSTPGDESVPQWYEFLYDGSTGARFYDANGQEIPPYSNATVARIDLHLIDGQRGDSDLTANGQIDDPGGPAFVEVAPRVSSVVVNDGHSQRSMVNSISIVFSELVTIDSDAFQIQKVGTRQTVKLQVTLDNAAGYTTARLTFKGAGVVGGSLADGQYRLIIRSEKIRSLSGALLDGDGDGHSGGNYVDEFFRRFGDTDGDGDVDTRDRDTFQGAFGRRSHQRGYLWYLDFNANGRIWAEDAAHFWKAYCASSKRS